MKIKNYVVNFAVIMKTLTLAVFFLGENNNSTNTSKDVKKEFLRG